jgi:hypothetical protein
MTKTSTTPKKAERPAKRKRAVRRAFPYEKVAALWAQEKTIPEIAKAIERVGKGNDKFHALRIFLSKMHKGYKNAEGNIVKLPYRISRKTLKLATKAGKRAAQDG